MRENKDEQVPRIATWLLSKLVKNQYHEEFLGDLQEIYLDRESTQGRTKARLMYWVDAMHLLLGFFYVRRTRKNHADMFKHNMLITFRNFRRYKGSFLINLIGLSTGLACVLLIYLWVADELRMDKFHEKDEHLYQVMHNIPTPEGIQTTETTQGLLAEALAEAMPEVEHAVAVVSPSWFSGTGILSNEDERLKARAQYVGESYFDVFTCHFSSGTKANFLSKKQAVAISDNLAQKLFKSKEDAIGKSFHWDLGNLGGEFEVVATFEALPDHLTDPFDLLFHYELFFEKRPFLKNWGNSDPSTYLTLREGVDIEQFNAKITDLLHTKIPTSKHSLFVRKFSDRYLYNRFENGVQSGGRIEYVRLFSVIAFFILLIACINFMNLSTARASRRLKEIGVKKTFGANRRMLAIQYLSESLLMALFAMLTAYLLVLVLLPQFNMITGKDIALAFNLKLILGTIAITALTGLFAGSYPAIYLSGFQPISILKGGGISGKLLGGFGEQWTRKGLVVFQFVLSTVFLVFVFVIYQQISYVQTKNLGYKRDNMVHFPVQVTDDEESEEKVQVFIDELSRIPSISSVGNFSHDLMGDHGSFRGLDWKEGKEDSKIGFRNLEVGFGFLETLGIEMREGRAFSKERGESELNAIIINEEAANLMGFDEPIGKTVRFWGEDRKIIGVAKDFHFESLYESVKPCVIQVWPGAEKVVVKIEPGNEQDAIEALEKRYSIHYPGLDFEYQFLDEDYQALYISEQRVSSLAKYAAIIAIIISCLGLLGLASYTTERRVKEIGIRKILGSSVWGIVHLLSSEFVKLVVIGISIAIPISFIISSQWLENFAYHIELEWWFFVGAALIALLVAWLTVSSQTIRAARIHPGQYLRHE